MLTEKKLRAVRNAVSSLSLLEEEKPPRVVFTTMRDNKVDDIICVELAGLAFEIDDPLRPIIPDDTHRNCRCYYVTEDTGEIVTNISSRRSVKKRNKLTDRQRKNYLKKNKKKLTNRKLDLIVETMEKNIEWQTKLPDYPYRKPSLEQIHKWLDML